MSNYKATRIIFPSSHGVKMRPAIVRLNHTGPKGRRYPAVRVLTAKKLTAKAPT